MAVTNGVVLQDCVNLLGLRVRDKVTGFSGVVSSVAFDLYGCVMAVVTPKMTDAGKLEDGKWFDVQRLEGTAEGHVMPVPDFARNLSPLGMPDKGPAEKPAR